MWSGRAWPQGGLRDFFPVAPRQANRLAQLRQHRPRARSSMKKAAPREAAQIVSVREERPIMRPIRVPAADLEQHGAEKACAPVRAGQHSGPDPAIPRSVRAESRGQAASRRTERAAPRESALCRPAARTPLSRRRERMVDGVGQGHENGGGSGEEKEHPPVRPSRSGQRPSSAAIVGTVTSSSGCASLPVSGKAAREREGRPSRGAARSSEFHLHRPRIAAGPAPGKAR